MWSFDLYVSRRFRLISLGVGIPGRIQVSFAILAFILLGYKFSALDLFS